MSVKSTHHRISLTLSKNDFESFEHLYPHCLSKFLRNCISYATCDREFFQSVFFQELDTSLQEYCVSKMINSLDGVLK